VAGLTGGRLDVFHLLHCVNHLRKVIDSDYYQSQGQHRLRIHMGKAAILRLTCTTGPDTTSSDHCLDVLRQSVQCHGDLTPIRTGASPTAPTTYYSDSVQVHKCRNFDKVRDWLTRNRELFEIEFFKWE